MKKIIFTRPDGGLSVVHPTEGARLANSVTLKDGSVVSSESPRSADTFKRGWPIDGATADWAETEDEFVSRIAKKDVPANAIGVRIVDEASIPTDRTFRNAWEDNNGVSVNMDKAREIHKERLRELRKPLFAALDVRYMCADEAGDVVKKVEIAAEKQALRDSTADPAIAAATTPEELAFVVPLALAKA